VPIAAITVFSVSIVAGLVIIEDAVAAVFGGVIGHPVAVQVDDRVTIPARIQVDDARAVWVISAVRFAITIRVVCIDDPVAIRVERHCVELAVSIKIDLVAGLNAGTSSRLFFFGFPRGRRARLHSSDGQAEDGGK
jgi:hypothetical protein